jgi:hypothetical protein
MERIMMLDVNGASVLDSSLHVKWQSSKRVDLSRGRAFVVHDSSNGAMDPLLVEELDLDTGLPLWTSPLGFPSAKSSSLIAPPALGDDGNVHLVTATSTGGLGKLFAVSWSIDPHRSNAPVASVEGPIPALMSADGSAQVIITPSGRLLPGAKIALSEVRTLDASGKVMPGKLVAFDFASRSVLWSEAIQSEVEFIEEDSTVLVRTHQSLWRIGADAKRLARFDAAPGTVINGVIAHHATGGVLLSGAGSSDGVSNGLTYVDASLAGVWAAPQSSAFGGAFDSSGRGWSAGRHLVQLLSVDQYRMLIE